MRGTGIDWPHLVRKRRSSGERPVVGSLLLRRVCLEEFGMLVGVVSVMRKK